MIQLLTDNNVLLVSLASLAIIVTFLVQFLEGMRRPVLAVTRSVPLIKVAFDRSGYVVTVKEVVALAVASVLLVGGWFGLAGAGGYRIVFALTTVVGVVVAVFVTLLVMTGKRSAVSPLGADVTVAITGVQATGQVGSVVPSIAGTGTVSQPLREAARFLGRLGGILDADPVQIAAYRQTHMHPSLIDARGGSEAGTPLPLREEPEPERTKPKANTPIQSATQHGGRGNAIYQVAGDLIQHGQKLLVGGSPEPELLATPIGDEPDFSVAPVLRWLDPAAELVNLSTHVDVWCENSGPSESVAVVLRRWAEVNRPDLSSTWEELRFEEFNVPSYIRSVIGADNRRFLVKIRSSNFGVRELGPRLMRWSVLYKDGDLRNGYITTASMVANFSSPGAAEISEVALDATSTLQVRNRRYLDWIAQHGEPST